MSLNLLVDFLTSLFKLEETDFSLGRRDFLRASVASVAGAYALLNPLGYRRNSEARAAVQKPEQTYHIQREPRGLASKEALVWMQDVDNLSKRYNIPTIAPGQSINLKDYLTFIEKDGYTIRFGSKDGEFARIIGNGILDGDETLGMSYGAYSGWIEVRDKTGKRTESVRVIVGVVPSEEALRETCSIFDKEGCRNLESVIDKGLIGKLKEDLKKLDMYIATGKSPEQVMVLEERLNEMLYQFDRQSTIAKLAMSYDATIGLNNVTERNDCVSTPGPAPFNANELYMLGEIFGAKEISRILNDSTFKARLAKIGINVSTQLTRQVDGVEYVKPEAIKAFYDGINYTQFSLPPVQFEELLRKVGKKRALEILTFDTIPVDDEVKKGFLNRVFAGEWHNGKVKGDHTSLHSDNEHMRKSDLGDVGYLFRGAKKENLEDGPYVGVQLSVLPRNLGFEISKQPYTIEQVNVYKTPGIFGRTIKKSVGLISETEAQRLFERGGYYSTDFRGQLLAPAVGKTFKFDGDDALRYLASLPEARAWALTDIEQRYPSPFSYTEDGKVKYAVGSRQGTAFSVLRELARLGDGIIENEPKDSPLYGHQYVKNLELTGIELRIKPNTFRSVH